MTKLLAIIIFIFALFSCHTSATKSKQNIQQKQYHIIKGKKFFNYDKIDYYHSNFDSKNSLELLDSEPNSLLDSIKVAVLFGETPESINDTSCINQLTKVGYTKQNINKEKFSKIDSIFIEKTTTTNDGTNCVYIYRDILIFKKQNKIIGIAKICFSCFGNRIVGAKANKINFGQDGDYDKLKSIIYQ
jgi:hypothetical protein